MGYYVKALPNKQSHPKWRLQFVSYKNADIVNSKAKKPKREWQITKSRWASLGFHSLMNANEAKIRARQLNSQSKIKKLESQIQKLDLERIERSLRYDSVLPSEFVEEFEARFIRSRDSETTAGRRRTSRAHIAWRAAQKLIVAVALEPSEWFFNSDKIYDYFFSQKMSIRYSVAVLRLVNLWGFYISRKLGRSFLQVTAPRGYERQRIAEANFEKRESVSRASKPLTPVHLGRSKQKINQQNFNWLYLSIWLGLRPQEIDQLKNPEMFRIERTRSRRTILWIFQTKIIALPKEDRWKPIPILYEQQKFALRIIETKSFRRPLRKTMISHFGSGITLYAGRKGFTDLMLSKGHTLENISVWMGHSTLTRTWRSYKQRQKFHIAGF